MAEATTAHSGQGQVGRLAARALLKLLDGLRSADLRVTEDRIEPVDADAPPLEWSLEAIAEGGVELTEEELLVLVELAEEQDDPFVAPLRPCLAVRRSRASRSRRLTAG
jgi:hypothetical protein